MNMHELRHLIKSQSASLFDSKINDQLAFAYCRPIVSLIASIAPHLDKGVCLMILNINTN